jgi:hypothetical protein
MHFQADNRFVGGHGTPSIAQGAGKGEDFGVWIGGNENREARAGKTGLGDRVNDGKNRGFTTEHTKYSG